jgi:hypothetical protein
MKMYSEKKSRNRMQTSTEGVEREGTPEGDSRRTFCQEQVSLGTIPITCDIERSSEYKKNRKEKIK